MPLLACRVVVVASVLFSGGCGGSSFAPPYYLTLFPLYGSKRVAKYRFSFFRHYQERRSSTSRGPPEIPPQKFEVYRFPNNDVCSYIRGSNRYVAVVRRKIKQQDHKRRKQIPFSVLSLCKSEKIQQQHKNKAFHRTSHQLLASSRQLSTSLNDNSSAIDSTSSTFVSRLLKLIFLYCPH